MQTLKAFTCLLLCLAAGMPAYADEIINISAPANGDGWTFSGNVVTITADGNYTVTGTSDANRVVINKDVTATITLQNANIHSADASPFSLSSDIIAGGRGSHVTLILSETNELVSTDAISAGLTVEDSARITIEGSGSLLAQATGENPEGGAGIGSGSGKAAGTVIIKSGTVIAIGGFASAGIGSGADRAGGSITVAGGTIIATGGEYAAGIGGGLGGNGGNITVAGGTIIATGGNTGAGIGGGRESDGGYITLTGGTITATGGEYAAGIGGGGHGNGGNIIVSGGTITANGSTTSAGIGGGYRGNGGYISISNGIIVAVTPGGSGEAGDAAAIGGGGLGDAETVIITGGTVYASSGTGAGIGGGAGATGGNISIAGGTVIADEVGIGNGSTTATDIFGANTIVLSPSINTTTFGGATVLTGSNVSVSDSITIGDNVADVTLNAALTIPGGSILVVPAGIVFDVNYKALTNSGVIRRYGLMPNTESLTGNQPVGAIQSGWIADIPTQLYTGRAIEPAVTVTDGSLTLAHGVYYSVAYSNNVNVGTATVTITDLGNYSTVSKTFLIAIEDNTPTPTPVQIVADWIESIPAQTYTGDSLKPAITVRDGSNKILTPDADYTVAYNNNINVGTATVTVTGIGAYTGTVTKTFLIEDNTSPPPVQIVADWIENIPAQTYTGDSLKPAITVRDGSNKILTPDADYTVAYNNNINVGTATVTVTGIGAYTGTVTKTFLIEDNTPPAPVQIVADWLDNIPAQTYTGDSLKPAITVRDGSAVLTAGRDYTVVYDKNINVGTAYVTVTGTGNYTGTANKSFTINPKQIAGAIQVQNIPAQTYTGEQIQPAITVRDGSLTLTQGVHYIYICMDNVYVGTAMITITGVGNYTGTTNKAFTINPKPVAADWIEDIPAQTYTGGQIKPAVTVRDGSAVLTADGDYTITYDNNVNVGTNFITVIGTGNYTGTASKTFTINPKQITGDRIEDIPAQTYTGEQIKPAVTVTDGSAVLTAGRDYTVAYNNHLNVGTATVMVAGTGNYTGTASKSFAINPKPVAEYWIEDISNQTYTGEQLNPAVTVRDGSAVLTAGRDYTVTYDDNVNAGTATVTITGVGNYTEGVVKTFTINPKQIANDCIEDIPDQIYTGGAIEPAVIMVRDGSVVLTAGVHYTATCINNVKAGTATVVVTGTGNYSGVAYKYFIINPKPVADYWIENIPDQTYTGASILPAVTVRDGYDILAAGIHYIVTYLNNVEAGTATVTVTGVGNYTGTAMGTFNIVRSKVNIKVSWVQVIPDQYCTGYPLKPAVTVAGLTQNVDYTVSYYNNIYAGTGVALITGIGNYTGEVTKSFRIIDAGIEEAENSVLRIVSEDNGVFISGLTPGEALIIYTLQGQPVYESKATLPEAHIYLQDKGIYILKHQNKSYKFYR